MSNVRVNLKDFEKRVNESEETQKAFLANPITMLEEEGLVLSEQMQKSLIRYLRAEQLRRETAMGSSVGAKPKEFGLP
jgi:hypothetical protein